MKVYLEGHGCSASFADTEILGGLIQSGGHSLVEDPSEADIRVLVTCSVKTVTEQRMLSRMEALRNEGPLVVAGCLPKAVPQKILQIDPTISMIGPGTLDSILPALEATKEGRQLISLETKRVAKLGLPRTRKNNAIGIVEIASGCLSGCTFCQVKLVKGIVFSYPEDQIVSEVSALVREGAREIWLTSTDNACYGRDSKSSLPNLLRKVCALEGNFKVRVGMMNPLVTDKILDDLIKAFQDEKVFKFLHLPVQSGSNRILSLMKRGYTVENFTSMVDEFRSAIPDLTLSTDMIVGFPTETEEDNELSMELLRKVRPDVVNLSRFSPRDGTAAMMMEGQISHKISKERSKNMTLLIKEISKRANERWIGWEGTMLVDEIGKGAFVGRNYSYKPCVLRDGFISKSEIERKGLLGQELAVRAVSASPFTLGVAPIEENSKVPV